MKNGVLFSVEKWTFEYKLHRLKTLLAKFGSPCGSVSPRHERIQVSGSLIKLATRSVTRIHG